MSSRYLLRRLAQAAVTVVGIVTVTFVLVQLAPGDAADNFSESAAGTAQLRAELRLDRPLPEQLAAYAGRLVRGDLGQSFILRERSVTGLIGEFLPRTLLLIGTAVVLSSAAGVALAVRAAKRPGGPFDTTASLIALVGFAVPGFWLGQMAILLLALRLGLFPTGGIGDLRVDYTGFDAAVDVSIHLALPMLVLAASEVAMIFRITRSGVLRERQRDYVRTAVAKGMPMHRALSHHAMRNALLPLVTVFGARLGSIFSGAVIIERLFAWPGIGTLLVDATLQRDRPLVLGIVVVVSTAVVGVNLVTDLLYARIDPRIRYD